MNIPKLSSLSPEQKNVLISEVCGWRVINIREGFKSSRVEDQAPKPIPNFCGSLDACAEMRKALTEDQYSKYAYLLMKQVGLPLVAFDGEIAKALVRATPEQHVDATLLATGKAEL